MAVTGKEREREREQVGFSPVGGKVTETETNGNRTGKTLDDGGGFRRRKSKGKKKKSKEEKAKR